MRRMVSECDQESQKRMKTETRVGLINKVRNGIKKVNGSG